ncbi:DUF2255 family protein [Agrococcus carbonis]|uniref:DUF2255 family protein n=1 Tax=Agrococcus carbonis TaxID=684552 RepID=A0A1H1NQJ2_9MICO|nr:DUF2255 family protein [Agrococcus carbonis]SDS01080.1 hypothetical protein SAMN04489719_1332 [Agrococcus carbonis]
MTWQPDELAAVHGAKELEIITSRADGSLRKPVPIWHAAVDGELYVRSAYGPDSAWYRRTADAAFAHIKAGGVSADVTAEHLDEDDTVHDAIDAAMREKYGAWPESLATIVSPESRRVTLRLTPGI